MILRDIIARADNNFSEVASLPIVADDVRAYRFVFRTDYDLTGCVFVVIAQRADGVKITDTGFIQDNTAYYVIKNNMYNIVGETKFRLILQSADGSTLSAKEIICEVAEASGNADLTGDDRLPILTTLIGQTTSMQNKFSNFITGESELDGTFLADGSVQKSKLSAQLAAELDNKAEAADIPAVPEIADNLTTGDSAKVLSARQGKLLNDGKVDKVAGKGLSTYDFSSGYKSILDSGMPVLYASAENCDNLYGSGMYLLYSDLTQQNLPLIVETFENDFWVVQYLFTGGDIKYRWWFGEDPWEEWKSVAPGVANDLFTNSSILALSARQGKVLNESKQNKSVKYTVTVTTSAFANQPTVSGVLDASFELRANNYYFVTLKDTNGAALPANQFKLTANKDGYATAVNQIFTLAGLNTGAGTLTENTLVDFIAVGTNWSMGYAGVQSVEIPYAMGQTVRFCAKIICNANNAGTYLIPYFKDSTQFTHYNLINNSTNILWENPLPNNKKFGVISAAGEFSQSAKNVLFKADGMITTADSADMATGRSYTPKHQQPVTYSVKNTDTTDNGDMYFRLRFNTGLAQSLLNGSIFEFEVIT